MRRPRLTVDEGGPKVPGYIVTFSDMVTLLLTFFVMLLSLASVQDPELFDKGRDSFVDSLKYMGLGMFFGKQTMPQFGSDKNKYSISNPDESADRRTVDARAEELRRIFKELKQLTTTMPSQIVSKRTDYLITEVNFSPDRADLNEKARKFLTRFCRDLQQDASRKPVELYVLGLASDVKSEKEQWLLSARRGGLYARYFVFGVEFAETAKFVQGPIQMVCLFLGSGPGRRLGRAGQPVFQAVSDINRGSEGERLVCVPVKFFDNFLDYAPYF